LQLYVSPLTASHACFLDYLAYVATPVMQTSATCRLEQIRHWHSSMAGSEQSRICKKCFRGLSYSQKQPLRKTKQIITPHFTTSSTAQAPVQTMHCCKQSQNSVLGQPTEHRLFSGQRLYQLHCNVDHALYTCLCKDPFTLASPQCSRCAGHESKIAYMNYSRRNEHP